MADLLDRPAALPNRLGALAGTRTVHPFAPDRRTGSLCLACFGWADDPRHLIPPPRKACSCGGR